MNYKFHLLCICTFANLLISTASMAASTILSLDYLALEQAKTAKALLANPSDMSRFAPLASGVNASKGYQHWLRPILDQNKLQRGKNYFIEINFPNVDEFTAYVTFKNGTISTYKIGDEIPFVSWPVSSRIPTIPITNEGDHAQHVLIDLLDTGQPIIMPTTILTEDELVTKQQREYLWYGFLFGGILVLLAYNLSLYVFIRHSSYFWYVIYLGGFGVLLSAMVGLGQQYLWPRAANFTSALAFWMIGVTNMGLLLFVRSFLNLPEQMPRLSRAILAFAGVAIVVPVLLLFYEIIVVQYISYVVALIGIIAITIAVIRSALSGSRPAYYLLVSYFVLFSGIALSLLRFSGFIPTNFFTEHLMELAILVEAIILSIGLADRINQLNEKKNQLEIEKSADQQRFTHELIETQESERREFGRILHDTIGHELLLLKNSLTNGSDGLSMSSVSNKIVQVINHSRNLARETHPYMIESIGFPRALEDMIKHAFENSSILHSCHIDIEKQPDTIEQHLYRITQECITNTLKYSNASECLVVIRQEAGVLEYLYKDDGQGFDSASKCDSSGFGLRSVQERCKIINAVSTITTAPGEGFKLGIKINAK